ncbi:MAG TPA: flagellar hook protein FlgE [Bryobacteraceae bacterium]|nr:flagellar hook protein FlgE [Bryobacteraceae bacterium]
MLDSFNIALSGLNANSSAIDTTGDNLANLNTIGFKTNSVDFENLVSDSMSNSPTAPNGAGVGQPLDLRQFTQGTIQTSASPLSVAIQGDGFFVVNDNGQSEYTRAGNFTVDQKGTLVTATGQQVQGWMAAADGTLNPSGAVGNITIASNQVLAPTASTQFSADLNLDASGVGGQPSGTFSTPIQVVDSLGVTHDLTITFSKPKPAGTGGSGGTGTSTPGTWNYSISAPDSDFTKAPSKALASGSVTFDSAGHLTSPAASANGGAVEVDLTGLADGAADMKLQWNLYNSDGTPRITQFASPSSVAATSQDGNTASQLTGFSIGDGGQVLATYSNGTKKVAGQLAVAAISNPQSLVSVGNNNFAATSMTVTPAIGLPGTGDRGTVLSKSLEASNVDLATEFTNLMTYERAYQADSKVIMTSDDLMQSVVNLIQQ